MKNIMKNYELVIIVMLLVAHVPLLWLFVNRLSHGTFYYLNDKSIYRVQNSVEYEEDGKTIRIPRNLAAINIDFGTAMLLPAIADDYGPKYNTTIINSAAKPAQIVEYGYALDSLDYAAGDSRIQYQLVIHDGWTNEILDELLAVSSHAGGNADYSAYGDKHLYLMWNSRRQCWFITSEFINIFEGV